MVSLLVAGPLWGALLAREDETCWISNNRLVRHMIYAPDAMVTVFRFSEVVDLSAPKLGRQLPTLAR